MRSKPETIASVSVKEYCFTKKQIQGVVEASQFKWTFTYSFNKGLLKVNPPLGRALIENERLGNKATATGLQKGRRIASKSALSLKSVKNIFNYLKNAKKGDTGDWNDYGTIAFNLYGGNVMYNWCKKILENQTSK